MTEKTPTPWYKETWPWFIISLPLISVVAGIITYQLAATDPHSMVKDDYFKEGLAINQSIEKLQKAKTLNLSANITTDQSSQLITLKLTGNHSNIQSLQLIFSHPTQANLDQAVSLEKLGDNEFIAQIPNLPKAYWHVRISDDKNQWLLKSRWHYPESRSITINAKPNG
ncbi:FixH family protein [Aliikangiella maris]|uniref:FixH family protein n=2 Tax=Aliikangiella maris TaxID=3162458 RepID=A0ABV3MIP0_9GAMM